MIVSASSAPHACRSMRSRCQLPVLRSYVVAIPWRGRLLGVAGEAPRLPSAAPRSDKPYGARSSAPGNASFRASSGVTKTFAHEARGGEQSRCGRRDPGRLEASEDVAEEAFQTLTPVFAALWRCCQSAFRISCGIGWNAGRAVSSWTSFPGCARSRSEPGLRVVLLVADEGDQVHPGCGADRKYVEAALDVPAFLRSSRPTRRPGSCSTG